MTSIDFLTLEKPLDTKIPTSGRSFFQKSEKMKTINIKLHLYNMSMDRQYIYILFFHLHFLFFSHSFLLTNICKTSV